MVTALVGTGVAVLNMTSASAATVDTSATYVLVNRNSGKALDSDANNQQWQFVDSCG